MNAGFDPDHIVEMFAAFGPVLVRRMFGGAGIYAEGRMFALLADGVIYLKAGKRTVPAFQREGCKQFSYDIKDGKRALLSYWRLPERLYDDPDELAHWARDALAAARQAVNVRRKARPRRSRLKRARSRA